MDKLVLDTTYLLPIFKIKVKLKYYDSIFPTLTEKYIVLYNPISIIEAKWIVLKLCRKIPQRKQCF